MKFKLLSPEKTIVDTEIANAVVPGAEGYIGFLEGHVPYVTPLKTGILEISGNQGHYFFAVCGGYCEVSSQGIVVLAEYAQKKDDIDPNASRAELKDAEDSISQAPEDADLSAMIQKKEWAEVRLELAQR
jgi:F-type H+-transporting ATPase subunit epsilon